MKKPGKNENSTSTILLVDDSAVNLEVAVESLELDNYEVLVALDGEEALERAINTSPDLILLDIMMRGMDGYEVCRRLKEHARTRDIPVIFMTSLNGVQDKVEGFRAGAVDYVTKPLQIDEVRARVGVHLKVYNLQRQMEEKNLKLQEEIDERKRAEEMLRASRESLNEAQRIARVGSWELDLANNSLLWSEEIFRIFEIDQDKFSASYEGFLDAIHPDDREAVSRAYAESLANHTPYEIEHRLLMADGRIKYVYERCETRYGDDGKPLRSIGTVQDITERKATDRELTLLNYALDHVKEAALLTGEDAQLYYVNEGFCRGLGYTRAELLGLGVPNIDPDYQLERWPEHWHDLKTHKSLTFESRHKTKDGHIFPVEINANYFEFDGKGYNLALMRDITERKRMEEALTNSRDFLDKIVNSISDPIFVKDRQHRWVLINDAFSALLGQSRELLIGKSDFDFLPREQAEVFWEKDELVYTTSQTNVNEEVITDGNGNVRFLHTVKTPFISADGETLLVGVIRDITERKQTEIVLQENFARISNLNEYLEESARNLEEQAVELEASQEQLKQTEEWYRSILHSAPDGMLVVDERGIIKLVNEQLEVMFGYAEGEISGNHIEMLLPHALRVKHVKKRTEFIASGKANRPMAGVTANLRGCRRDGAEFPVDVSLSRLPDIDGRVGAICVSIRDITERKRMEEQLAASEQELRTLIDNSPDTLARYDRECRRIYANSVFVASTGGSLEDLLYKTPSEYPGGAHSYIYETKINEVFLSGMNSEMELKWLGRDGAEVCSHIRLTAERDASGQVITVLATGRDITELNVYRQKIHQMAFYDSLTSLPNRALFHDRLRQMLTEASWHGQIAGVMLLDLDHFKTVNDTLGHPAGDELLREVAARLMYCVRGYDTVARLGGDEFAILLPEIRSADDMGTIASKILASFTEPFMLDGKEMFISSSIGIAVYPEDSSNGDDLLRQADSAMYLAKRSGRNNFRFYSKDLSDSANERLALEGDLRRGLVRDELMLHFQPKVRANDGSLAGSEALLRWVHPQHGMVPPDKFISVAEDCGLIIEIGEWVLRNACRVACDWNGPAKPLHKVAINLSPRQFQSNDLVTIVRDVLDETGCAPEWIELEITESLLLDEEGEVLEMLEALRAMNITIAIDDFGTGYSALSYLARFPIDTLKIDRSFICRVTESGHHAELVKAIISIAKCLDQQVVAEGVETAEQAAFLQAHGCMLVQGYFYGKPMPKQAFEAYTRLNVER
jgi:diguanylate cyclase (GGDEF)-like protein/PAS domain S-box-containing protein